MKKKNKGFTLIELLAVIVILGLLMAIAIPSVTKYITQSRKKTLTNTIGNYMSALVNEVNDMVYTFTGTNTIYAVPIECIAVERGGTNPFGKWLHANNSYWAYVLVQYDDLTSSYKYGFTFKDSAGYGLYPTTQAKLNEKGSQIVTGLNLSKPTNGLITTITPLSNWTNSGFKVDSSTKIKVLVAGSEDQVGDGVNTCTLVQKGDNYASIEQEEINKVNTLAGTTWKMNKKVTDYSFLKIYSYEDRTGWDELPYGNIISGDGGSHKFAGLSRGEFGGYYLLGDVSIESLYCYHYFPANDFGAEEGWYYADTGPYFRGEKTIDEQVAAAQKVNPPTITFSTTDAESLQNKQLIDWFYENGTMQ